MAYKSYAATISLPTDFIGEIQEYFIKWLKKQDYAYGVVELDGSGKRHAHFQIWNEEPSVKGDKFKSPKREIAKLHPDAILKHAVKIKIAYNDDYINYMDKDNPEYYGNMLINNIPAGDTTRYYPSEEEQAKVQESANAVDKKFHKWRTDFMLWLETQEPSILSVDGEPTIVEVAKFLSDMMFKSKKYPVIIDKKNRVQNCKALYCYICNKTTPQEFLTQEQWEEYLLQLEAKMP